MTERNAIQSRKSPETPALGGLFASALEYLVDAGQRSILFWDVMRQRGNQYREHVAETAPHVLNYQAELIMDGRQLERPVNYCLVRIIRRPASRSTRRKDPSSSSIRGPVTALASAASRPTAKSESR
jgi:hypothetical protein